MGTRPPEITPVWDCQLCSLAKPGQKPIWGVGPCNPAIMIVGEAPGFQESKQGVPFYEHAPAGGLLTQLLKEVGLSRDQVYFSNSVRCFPGYDIEVGVTHIKACKPYLAQEIAAVDPKLIVLMGNKALKSVFGHEGVTKERGTIKTGPDGRQYFITLHPASALPSRFPDYRRVIKSDLKEALKIATRQSGSELGDLKLHLVDGLDQLEKLEKRLKALDPGTPVFFDFETNSLRTPFHGANVIISGISFCWREGESWFLPYMHGNPVDGWYVGHQAAIRELICWFLNSPLPKGGQNLKFDCLQAEGVFGIRPRNVKVDTMLLSHLIDPSSGIHALEKLALQVGLAGYGNELHDWFKDNGIANKDQDWSKAPLHLVAHKSMIDVLACYRFFELKYPIIEKRGQIDLYFKHIVPGMKPYMAMERHGMLVDQPYMDLLEQRYQERQAESSTKMRSLVINATMDIGALNSLGPLADEFNFNSTNQLGKLLDQWLRLHREAKIGITNNKQSRSMYRDSAQQELTITKSGRLSTDKANIETLLSLDIEPALKEFLKVLLGYKADQKRLSTYVQGLRKHICPDGRVRSTYLLHGTETARRSSASPNRQNDPTDAEVKRVYVSAPDHVFIVNDYSNLEVRVAAAISKDANLIKAFQEGLDIHSFVTSMAYNQDYERIVMVLKNADKYPKEHNKYFHMRDHCKRAMWTILFGGDAGKVANLTGLDYEGGKQLMDSILSKFPGLDKMFKRLKNFAVKYGRAENAFGRWRPLLGIESTDQGVQAHALRQGLNTPIQSTAADLTLTAARRLNNYIEKHEVAASLAMEVHDSFGIECSYGSAYDVLVNSRRIMESVTIPGAPEVPLKIDQIIGCHLGSKLKASNEILELARTKPRRLYRQLLEDVNHPPAYYEAKV